MCGLMVRLRMLSTIYLSRTVEDPLAMGSYKETRLLLVTH